MSERRGSSSAKTATDQTREHYNRPEVREAILRFCEDGQKCRALNGDQGWYASTGKGEVRLRTPGDYIDTITEFRTLYATLDHFEPEVKEITQPWDAKAGRPKETIGTFKNCHAYTLGADIDSIGNIIEDHSIKQAVEDAAKFLVMELNNAGITKSIHCLYSGGGIYVLIHHCLFQANPEWSGEEREQAFRSLTKSYNMWLANAETKFFEQHPEHKGKVKIDKINNQKRKFKCIFSIHKKYDLAVVPLDPRDINIDFERARLPISDDVLKESKDWYKDYSIDEKEALKAVLSPYVNVVDEDLLQRNEHTGDYEIFQISEQIPLDEWPPCIRNIHKKAEPGKGPHRACSVFAAYLYQAGWPYDEALEIWMQVANRCNVERRIFDQWYGQMCCPKCSTIQDNSAGYPKPGLGGLDYCEPDDRCDGCKWPGDYNKWSIKKIEDALRNNLSELSKPEIIIALSKLKLSNNLDYIMLLKRLKINGEMRKALENEISKYQQKMQMPEYCPEIREKALEILKYGDPIQFITDSCGRMVLGAEKAFKKLICCVSVQNIYQSAGLHPKLNGESGGGKTWALLTFAHHLPSEAVLKGSMSAKAGYYHKDGNRLLRILDDYQAGNEELDTTIKQTSSEFHETYTHRTVANHKGLTLEIGSEQTWAITSVDSSQDIQVLNRQIPINVDDSEELTKIINHRTIERYGEGEHQFPVDDTVLKCREIFRILREEGYINIRIPFYNRIEWFDTSNRRNPSIFMDILIGITAMNRYQREKDADGYTLATEDDFHAAKELFIERDAEELVHRLSKRERQFAELLVKHKEGMTREDAAKAMELSPSRISRLANGEKGKGGLLQKLPGFCAREITDYVNEYVPGVDKRAVRKTLYKLEGYNPLDGFDAIVKLRDSAPSADGVRVKVRAEVGAKIDNSEREKREIDRECAGSAAGEREILSEAPCGLPGDEKSSLSLAEEKNAHSHQETIAGATKERRTIDGTDAHLAHTEALDSGAHHSALMIEPEGISVGPNPRKDAPTPATKSSKPIMGDTCLICGLEIGPGHSSATFEGKNYCTSCVSSLSMIRASAKILTEKNGRTPATTEIYEDIALRGRPPRKEHMTAMLNAIGFVEKEGRWERQQEDHAQLHLDEGGNG